MARKFTIDTLPTEVRTERVKNYRQYPAWTINDHADWLREKGYDVSRSAVHRYLSMKAEEPAPPAHQIHAEQVRVRCLEVVSSYRGDNLTELKAIADSLIAWVKDQK